MSIEKRSDGFRQWIAEHKIFDCNIWWDPQWKDGFVLYDDFDRQMADYRALGLRGGIVTSSDAANRDPREGNEALAELLQGREGLFGCMVLRPEMDEEYIRSLAERGFAAARMYPETYGHGMEQTVIGPVLSTLEKLGLPLMLWHAQVTWEEMDRICTDHPGLQVIVESFDRKLLYHAKTYMALMQKHKNFFVETHNLVLFRELETISRSCGSGQLLYGSCYPYMTPHFSLYPVMQAEIAEGEKQAILWKNAKGIFPCK